MSKKTNAQADLPFPRGVAKPAQRALAAVGITRLEQVARLSETELRALHGMGSKAIEALKVALSAEGKSLEKG